MGPMDRPKNFPRPQDEFADSAVSPYGDGGYRFWPGWWCRPGSLAETGYVWEPYELIELAGAVVDAISSLPKDLTAHPTSLVSYLQPGPARNQHVAWEGARRDLL